MLKILFRGHMLLVILTEKKLKHVRSETRVTSEELQVQIHELRVQIHEL